MVRLRRLPQVDSLTHNTPHPPLLSSADEQQFRSLVVWLELNKIRCLPPEQRQPLKDTAAKQWPRTLTHYLTQLFPSPPHSQITLATPTSPLAVIDALLRYAVAVEYTDKADEYNKRASLSQPAAVHTAPQQSPAQQLPVYNEADIRAGLIALATQLHLPNPDTFSPPLTTIDLLTSLSQLLNLHTTLPHTTNPPLPPTEALAFVRQLPVPPEDESVVAGGGGGGGESVAVLVGVLRLLSVWRLRVVQERVTECLHGVQTQLRVGKHAGRVDIGRGQVGR